MLILQLLPPTPGCKCLQNTRPVAFVPTRDFDTEVQRSVRIPGVHIYLRESGSKTNHIFNMQRILSWLFLAIVLVKFVSADECDDVTALCPLSWFECQVIKNACKAGKATDGDAALKFAGDFADNIDWNNMTNTILQMALNN